MKRLILCTLAVTFCLLAVHQTQARTVKLSAYHLAPGDDAHPAITDAIQSGASIVIIDITDRELTVSRPIILRSDLELILEDGVVLAAAPGAFKGRADAMLSGTNVERITIQGKGKATLRMRKSDYQNPDLYPHSEWRHLIALRGAKGVTLRNLNLLSSGGDGIYLGCSPKMPYCMDVLIEDTTIDDHHRQGISIISAENLIIRHCRISKTSGTAPAAGIDFEPNHTPDGQRLINCLIENSIIEGNETSGIGFYTVYMEGGAPPQSITIRQCTLRDNGTTGTSVTTSFHRQGREQVTPPSGFIRFEDCTFTGNQGPAITLADHIPGVDLSFTNCKIDAANGAILLASRTMRGAPLGGVTFKNVTIDNLPANQDAIQYKTWTLSNLDQIQGDLTVAGQRYNLPRRINLLNQQVEQARKQAFQPAQADWRKFRSVTPSVSPDKLADLPAVLTRGPFAYALAAKAGEEVQVDVSMAVIRTMRPMELKIVNAKGQSQVEANLSYRTPQAKLTFKADEDGAYFLAGNSAADTLRIVSTTPGGVLINRATILAGKHNEGYFIVPANLETIRLQFVGRLFAPKVKVTLYNAQGKVVASNDAIEEPWQVQIKRPGRAREVWKMVVETDSDNAMSEVQFGQGLENLLAGSPSQLPAIDGQTVASDTASPGDTPGAFTGHEN